MLKSSNVLKHKEKSTFVNQKLLKKSIILMKIDHSFQINTF